MRSRTRSGTCRWPSSPPSVIGIAIYFLLQLTFIGAIPHNLISGPKGWAAIPSTSPIAVGPFAGLAGIVGLGWLAVAAADRRLRLPVRHRADLPDVDLAGRLRPGPQPVLPADLRQRTDRNGVPWFSLIFAFVVGLLFLLPFPSWHSLVGLVTSASVLMYAGAPLSLGAFRGQVPEAPRPYRMPGAVVARAARVLPGQPAHLLVGLRGDLEAGDRVVVGYVLIGIWMAIDPKRPPLDWRSATWLPFYLIGMGVISWQGQFSGAPSADKHPLPPTNTFNIPFWWDIAGRGRRSA